MSGGVFGGQPVGMHQRVKECSHVGGKGTTERLIGILQAAFAVLDDQRQDASLASSAVGVLAFMVAIFVSACCARW
jgi:hypothetical protein